MTLLRHLGIIILAVALAAWFLSPEPAVETALDISPVSARVEAIAGTFHQILYYILCALTAVALLLAVSLVIVSRRDGKGPGDLLREMARAMGRATWSAGYRPRPHATDEAAVNAHGPRNGPAEILRDDSTAREPGPGERGR